MLAFPSHANLVNDGDGNNKFNNSKMYIYSQKLAKSEHIVLSENI